MYSRRHVLSLHFGFGFGEWQNQPIKLRIDGTFSFLLFLMRKYNSYLCTGIIWTLPWSCWIRILSIWNKMESLHFMVQIKYHRSNSVQTATSFKILNDKAISISLDLWNKIWTMKWTNGEISKWRDFQMERILIRSCWPFYIDDILVNSLTLNSLVLIFIFNFDLWPFLVFFLAPPKNNCGSAKAS